MKIIKEYNGYEYEIEVPDNAIIAKKVVGNYIGYKITQSTEGYTTKLFLQNEGFFEDKDKKCIGTLIYRPETDKVVLFKKINPDEHIHIKTNSFGINNEIIKNLRTSDYIVVDDNKNTYCISVAKALKVGQYLHFTKFELQLFIPIDKFKKIK